MRAIREPAVLFDPADIPEEPFETPIQWLLIALLAFMPFAMGASRPWSEFISFVGIGTLAVLLALKHLLRPDLRFAWSWAYVPIFVFILFVAFQLAPLPVSLIKTLSPKTVETKTALLSDLPNAAERLKQMSLSFYPEQTWHDLRLLVAVATIFIVTLNTVRRLSQMNRLLWAITFIGLAQALLGIVQNVLHAPRIYWLVSTSHFSNSWADAGSFYNHNFFAQFINLSCGAALGLLLIKMDQTFRRHDYTPAEVGEKLASAEFRPALLLGLILAIAVGSLFLSTSRGGVLSLAAAGFAFGFLLALRGGARGMGAAGWIVGLLAIIVFVVVMIGGANLVESRLSTIGNARDRYNRFELTKNALTAWRDYPVTGFGLGDHEYVFPRYKRLATFATATHVENEFAQLLEETGLIGGAAALAFIVIITACFFRARARGKRGAATEPSTAETPSSSSHRSARHKRNSHGPSPTSSLALGLAFGLIAILIQSALDFGQHYLALASLTTVFCALMVNLARLRRRERGLEFDPPPARGSYPLRFAGLLCSVLVFLPLLWQAGRVWQAAIPWDRSRELYEQFISNNWEGDPGDFKDMMRTATQAASIRPGNIEYDFWSAIYRWYWLSRSRTATGQIIYPPGGLDELQQIDAELDQSRWACPTYGALYAQIGQWEWHSLNRRDAGERHIRLAFELDPNDPTTCYAAAVTDADLANWSASLEEFRRAAELDSTMLPGLIDIFLNNYDRPDLALDLAGRNVAELRGLATKLRAKGKPPATAPAATPVDVSATPTTMEAAAPTTSPATRPSDEAIAIRAEALAIQVIQEAADQPDASPTMLADMGMLSASRKDFPGAIRYLNRALALDYGRTDWRMEFARILARAGRKEDAIHQAEIVLHQRPRLPEALELIDRLSTPTSDSRLDPLSTAPSAH